MRHQKGSAGELLRRKIDPKSFGRIRLPHKPRCNLSVRCESPIKWVIGRLGCTPIPRHPCCPVISHTRNPAHSPSGGVFVSWGCQVVTGQICHWAKSHSNGVTLGSGPDPPTPLYPKVGIPGPRSWCPLRPGFYVLPTRFQQARPANRADPRQQLIAEVLDWIIVTARARVRVIWLGVGALALIGAGAFI